MHTNAADERAGVERVLLYDGVCALCNRAVRFILDHDSDGSLQFAPLDGAFARGVRERYPALAGVDSIVLVVRDSSGESVLVRSDAALEIAGYLGGAWRGLRGVSIVPRVVRDWGYDMIAARRYRVFGRLDACPLPPVDVRSRFVD